MSTSMYKLFTPLKIHQNLVLKNRVVMAPMTRARSEIQTRQANELNRLYYEQRAGAGLIISEATPMSEQGYGWLGSPALYTQEHAEAWGNVVAGVHAKGGKIFAQLWHMGRQAHPSFNSKNEIVAPSAIGLPGGQIFTAQGEPATFQTPRALATDEIAEVVDDFRKSAALAKDAGFDGVEIHAANGYLIETFLQDVSNKRTDKYGGSIENRYRFLGEIVTAVKQVLPSKQIAVRVSPNGAYGGMGSATNFDQYTYVAKQLSKHDLAYLAILDGMGFGYHDKGRLLTVHDMKQAFKGVVMANCSYTRDTAEGVLRSGSADLVSFGRPYISTPDLAERFQNDWPLNPDAELEYFWDPSKGAAGYTSFPFHKSS